MSKLFTVLEVKEKIEALQKEWQEETNRLVNEARKEASQTQSKRNELLQVATQLAAGMSNYAVTNDIGEETLNETALEQAKHLISLVDKECGE